MSDQQVIEMAGVQVKPLGNGSYCPVCSLELTDIWDSEDRNWYLVHKVDTECDWELKMPGIQHMVKPVIINGAPECPLGHKDAWGAKQLGRRLDLTCLYHLGGGDGCAVRMSYWPQGYVGFANSNVDTPRNSVKATVLETLNRLNEATITEISDSLPLTRPQVAACITRCLERGYVNKSVDKVFVPPDFMAYSYSLTSKGKSWVNWATDTGLMIQKG